jgi:rhodanese-related sulfurtransferase
MSVVRQISSHTSEQASDLQRRKRYYQAMRQFRVLSFVCVALLYAFALSARAQDTLISAPDAYQAARSGEITLIDVRSTQEWKASGVPASALAVSIHQAGGPRAFYEAVLAATGGDKQRPIALICAAGTRSVRALHLLAEAGFTRLLNVAEGMEGSQYGPGWRRRGLPTVPWER